MNTYRYQFACNCPVNGKSIIYSLTIESEETIYVEDIVAAAHRHPTALHERLADSLHKHLGGRQVLKAHHHGVDVETVRE